MPKSSRKIALVDGENVGSLSKYSSLPSDYETIYYFLGATQHLSSELTGKHPDIRVIEIAKVGKNNLDFHLSAYLGYLHNTVSSDFIFEVISKDTGFDGIIGFINQNWNRKCYRESTFFSHLTRKLPLKIQTHFISRNQICLPKSINALRNYLIAQSLSTVDNVDEHVETLFKTCLLYLDFQNRVRYDRIGF